MRVGLFITCLNDTFFPDVGKATVRLLERLGCEVVFPEEQTCCGQMHANTGYPGQAADLAARFTGVFDGVDRVVTPSGSCAAMVRHQYPDLIPEAGEWDGRVFELSEFIVDELGVTDVGARFPHRVALHPTCHSMRILQVGGRPRQLLENVRDLELVELPNSRECCGFGGTFSVKNADISMAMVDDKIESAVSSGAEILTAGDSSCLMHIGGAASRRKSPVRTMHLAEILAAEG